MQVFDNGVEGLRLAWLQSRELVKDSSLASSFINGGNEVTAVRQELSPFCFDMDLFLVTRSRLDYVFKMVLRETNDAPLEEKLAKNHAVQEICNYQIRFLVI